MKTKEKILADMKQAMKSKNKETKSALRMLLSEIQYAETAVNKDIKLEENAILKVVSSYRKKLEKSLQNYPEGEQKNKLHQEIAIISSYLPKQATKEEIEKIVETIIQTSQEKNFGTLMKLTIKELGVSAHAKTIGEVIKQKIKS